MATTMKGIIGGGTTFSASPATVSVPTGSYEGDLPYFVIPANVHILALSITIDVSGGIFTLDPVYIGVTPGSYHKPESFSYEQGQTMVFGVQCSTHDNMGWMMHRVPLREFNSFTYRISWSPEINKKTPTITDY